MPSQRPVEGSALQTEGIGKVHKRKNIKTDKLKIRDKIFETYLRNFNKADNTGQRIKIFKKGEKTNILEDTSCLCNDQLKDLRCKQRKSEK